MSEQERKQDELIAMIFAKFDSDGSGALDLNELVDLFKQNKVKLDKPTVKLMFQRRWIHTIKVQSHHQLLNWPSKIQRRA